MVTTLPWQKSNKSSTISDKGINTESRGASENKSKQQVEVPQVGEPASVNKSNPGNNKNVIAEVANKERPIEEKVVETKQIVTFKLDEEEFASPIVDLKEIIRIPQIVVVPSAPPFIKGIFNLRGQVVVVVDLEKRFELKREHQATPNHIIIVESQNAIFGVVVDEVTGVLRVPLTSIKTTPSIITSKIRADYVEGVIVLSGEESTTPLNKDDEESDAMAKGDKTPGSLQESSRMLLLLDLPKMLQEEELLEFGTAVQATTKKVE